MKRWTGRPATWPMHARCYHAFHPATRHFRLCVPQRWPWAWRRFVRRCWRCVWRVLRPHWPGWTRCVRSMLPWPRDWCWHRAPRRCRRRSLTRQKTRPARARTMMKIKRRPSLRLRISRSWIKALPTPRTVCSPTGMNPKRTQVKHWQKPCLKRLGRRFPRDCWRR